MNTSSIIVLTFILVNNIVNGSPSISDIDEDDLLLNAPDNDTSSDDFFEDLMKSPDDDIFENPMLNLPKMNMPMMDSIFQDCLLNNFLSNKCVSCSEREPSIRLETCRHNICNECLKEFGKNQTENCIKCQTNIEKFRRIEKLPIPQLEVISQVDKKTEKKKKREQCPYCSIGDPVMTFQECGHCVCKDCADQVKIGASNCPSCDGRILKIVDQHGVSFFPSTGEKPSSSNTGYLKRLNSINSGSDLLSELLKRDNAPKANESEKNVNKEEEEEEKEEKKVEEKEEHKIDDVE
ncbi:uncharacterized protein LOC126904707 [Daktulosphaira vitifoliae]|uniref:uncharacterized protein LOC126904707 n=1 Tax=Daktulosphaira vitifoliae TaxID=58002 RepID=UPI0021AA5102|nr:uncharacterized protein LOC126904707 [Daktulosphaira vitifoliae]